MIAPAIDTAWNALYCAALRDAIPAMSDEQLRVWLLLTTYADDAGVCWPGYAEIAQRTGYRKERVIEIVDELDDCGLIVILRRAHRDPLTKTMTPNVYMVSPLLMATRRAPEGVDFSLIMERVQISSLKRTRNHHQEVLPRTTAKEPQPEPPPTTAKSPRKETETTGAPAIAPAGKAKSKSEKPKAPATDSQQGEAPQREARQTARSANPPPRSRAAPPADLTPYSVPLTDENAESLAESIRQELGNISAPNARALVDFYGRRRVGAAMRIYRKQTGIYNPAGFVKALLSRRGVDPDKDAPPVDQPAVASAEGSKYISGEFGQFVKFYTPESESEQEPTDNE